MAALVALLSGCTTAPVPSVPDGSSRVAVNDPDRLAQLHRQTVATREAVVEQTALGAEVSALRQQVQEMRAVLRVLLMTTDIESRPVSAQTPRAPTIAHAPLPLNRPRPGDQPLSAVDRSVDTVPGGLVFRIFYSTGASNFQPPTRIASALGAAARDAQTIEIRGRTDSAVATDANRRVALERAFEARRWLLRQGADPARIHVRFNSNGHFLVADASTAGRALNRRVEVETRGDMQRVKPLLASDAGGS